MNKDLLKNLQLFAAAEDEVVDILDEVDMSYPGMPDEMQLEVVKAAQMIKIIDRLEQLNDTSKDIDQCLDRIANVLEKLSSCVSDYRQFCVAADVTGSIETD